YVSLQCYHRQQHLRSFPTRRSSDLDFLKREVQQAQEELEQIDNNLFAMNNKDDVRMLAERHGVLLENMAEITTELERKKNQLISLQRLANPEVAADPDVRIAVLSQNTDYSALDKELRTLLLQRVALEPDAGARNPELLNLNRRIEELQKI